MKKILITLAILLIVFAAAIFIIGRTFYPDHIAETSPDGGKKDLKTRFYATDIETVKNAVQEIIPTLSTYGSNWKIAGETETENELFIKAEVPVIFFTDDLEVKIKKADNLHEIQVDAVSKSRIGNSDFGENARHVRQILNALDEKFGKN
ncbi:MAG: DUF1499 domain-containing protein [Aridibacter sp.]